MLRKSMLSPFRAVWRTCFFQIINKVANYSMRRAIHHFDFLVSGVAGKFVREDSRLYKTLANSKKMHYLNLSNIIIHLINFKTSCPFTSP
jgi:hypothetical protein